MGVQELLALHIDLLKSQQACERHEVPSLCCWGLQAPGTESGGSGRQAGRFGEASALVCMAAGNQRGTHGRATGDGRGGRSSGGPRPPHLSPHYFSKTRSFRGPGRERGTPELSAEEEGRAAGGPQWRELPSGAQGNGGEIWGAEGHSKVGAGCGGGMWPGRWQRLGRASKPPAFPPCPPCSPVSPCEPPPQPGLRFHSRKAPASSCVSACLGCSAWHEAGKAAGLASWLPSEGCRAFLPR